MTRSTVFTAALLAGLLGTIAPAAAQGPDPAKAAIRDQIRTIMTDFRTLRRTYQDEVVACGRTYIAAVGLALALDDAALELLEEQLDAAYEAAETRFEALPEADQLPATLRAYILEDLKVVTDAATADAGIRATLDAAAVAFVDCVLPIKAVIATLREDTRAAIKALRAS